MFRLQDWGKTELRSFAAKARLPEAHVYWMVELVLEACSSCHGSGFAFSPTSTLVECPFRVMHCALSIVDMMESVGAKCCEYLASVKQD